VLQTAPLHMKAGGTEMTAQAKTQGREYTLDPTWGRLPDGATAWGVVPAVAVDAQDRVYVNRRAKPSVVVYSRSGDILSTWGEQFEKGAHGLVLRKEADGEYLYFTDFQRHCIVKCTLDGREMWTLGEPGRPGAAGQPFNKPTDIAFTPDGDFYVSDGYGNRRVHHYDPQLKLVGSFGEEGTGPGQFSLVHHVWFDTRHGRRRLWVCDRENGRLQVFSPDGKYITELTGFRRPNSIWADAAGYLYVAELGARLTVLDPQDQVIAHIGGEDDPEPGRLKKPHYVCGDSHGSLYIAEVEDGARIQKFNRTR
jgi:DNA-binding beta-propeller fold protein YncE